MSSEDSYKNDSTSGKATCQGCGIKNNVEQLLRCKGCESVWYCNKVSFWSSDDHLRGELTKQKDCQRIGWSKKGHKKDCKILKSVGEIDFNS